MAVGYSRLDGSRLQGGRRVVVEVGGWVGGGLGWPRVGVRGVDGGRYEGTCHSGGYFGWLTA